MKKYFSDVEIKKIESSIIHFEEVTGRELLIIATPECDPYPAASLRFAFVATVLTLVALLFTPLSHDPRWWVLGFVVLFIVYGFLGKYRFFKKLALSDVEVDRECGEKSIEYFYQYASSHIANGSTMMILLSELEGHINILVDEALKDVINAEVRNSYLQFFKEQKKHKSFAMALETLIVHIEASLKEKIPGNNSFKSIDKLANTIYFIP